MNHVLDPNGDDRHMLLSTYEHPDSDETFCSLEIVLAMYARPVNWGAVRNGETPHFLRKG